MRKTVPLLLGVAGVAAMACSGADESRDVRALARTPSRAAQEEVAAMLPKLNVEKHFLRSFTAADQAEPRVLPDELPDPAEDALLKRIVKPAPAPPGKVSIIHTDHVNHFDEEWLIDESELANLGKAAAELGMNEASSGSASTSTLVPDTRAQGWAG
ncbi:MAG: hypothetical protein KC766_10065 [Myxococcales bacterium]|nr:hypothetical protein [Myxococcales bacterium]